MPTKVLTWNIERFTSRRIDPTNQQQIRIPPDGAFTKINSLRFYYILKNILDNKPDVFILIELNSDQGPRGTLVSGNGAIGVLQLLNLLRTTDEDSGWCLVPPVKMVDKLTIDKKNDSVMGENSYTESVAVFYKSTKLDFVGPFIWPVNPPNGNPNKIAVNTSKGVPGPYPDHWQQCLPAGNYFAGIMKYDNGQGLEKFFSTERCRNPFFTKFIEKEGRKRTLNIVSVHYPPDEATAKVAFANTLSLFSYYRLAANDLTLITGDYNIDVDKNTIFFALMQDLYKFQTLLRTLDTPSTLYKKPQNATPPDGYKGTLSVDNASIRYGGEPAKEMIPVARIIDRVLPSPPSPVPGLLYNTMNQIMQLPPVKRYTLFRQPFNFGTIGKVSGDEGTSDHLAVLYTI